MPQISVLVPVYNVNQYLPVCLDSLLRQSMADIEILCLNDGSTDNSLAILREYEKKDSRIRVIDKKNTGYGHTMNLGIREARGEYIGIVESDDFIEPEMFGAMYSLAKEHDVDVLKTDFFVYTNSDDEYHTTMPGDFYNKVISAQDTLDMFVQNSSIWSSLYRREFLIDNAIWFTETPGASFQDIAFRIKVFACAKRVFFLDRAFYHYRRDNPGASVRSEGKLYCVCDEYAEAERFLQQRPEWKERYQYLLPFLRFDHYHWNCFGRWLSWHERHRFYQQMVKEFEDLEGMGLLRQEYWRAPIWYILHQMLGDSRKFFYERYCVALQKKLLLHGLLSMISNENPFLLYGAGQIGTEVARGLKRMGINPAGFVVSNISNNPEQLCDLPVSAIDDWLEEKETTVILLTVKEASQAEILDELYRLGFVNRQDLNIRERLIQDALHTFSDITCNI